MYDRSGNVNLARRVMFKPMLGLFNQEKLHPLRYCPFQIELELVNYQADAVTLKAQKVPLMVLIGILVISNVHKCDLLTLDNSLDNEYASHLLSGKSLPINFNTWNHTNQSTGNENNYSAHITPCCNSP